MLERLHAMSSQLALSVTIGFSREMLDAYDAANSMPWWCGRKAAAAAARS